MSQSSKNCWELPKDEICDMAFIVSACCECPSYSSESPLGLSERRLEPRPGVRKILIADDEFLIRWSFSHQLNDAGFQVTTAETASEAIDYLSKSYFDYVLLDYKLPDKTGFDVFDSVQDSTKRGRFLLMTAYGSESTRQGAKERGMHYLPKPVSVEYLTEVFS